MTDTCEEWVDRAIRFTLEAMAEGAVEWRVARRGLTKMTAGMKGCPPDHPAFDRIRRFIDAHDSLVECESGARH